MHSAILYPQPYMHDIRHCERTTTSACTVNWATNLACQVIGKVGAAAWQASNRAPPARPVCVGDRVAGGCHESDLARQPRIQAARSDLHTSVLVRSVDLMTCWVADTVTNPDTRVFMCPNVGHAVLSRQIHDYQAYVICEAVCLPVLVFNTSPLSSHLCALDISPHRCIAWSATGFGFQA